MNFREFVDTVKRLGKRKFVRSRPQSFETPASSLQHNVYRALINEGPQALEEGRGLLIRGQGLGCRV